MTEANIVIILIVFVAIFFICRELLCWYWKINEAISHIRTIENQNDYTIKQNEKIIALLEMIATEINRQNYDDAQVTENL